MVTSNKYVLCTIVQIFYYLGLLNKGVGDYARPKRVYFNKLISGGKKERRSLGRKKIAEEKEKERRLGKGNCRSKCALKDDNTEKEGMKKLS